jgi:hypothetical protein
MFSGQIRAPEMTVVNLVPDFRPDYAPDKTSPDTCLRQAGLSGDSPPVKAVSIRHIKMNNMKKQFIFLIAILTINIAKAQLTNYSTANSGLTDNNVVSIAIDKQGNKWFGTYDNGVSKFDGANWTTYNTSTGLIHNNVFAIAVDTLGMMWFATGYGVSVFDGTNWTTYQNANSGLVCDNVMSMVIDAKNNKWFGTNNGVSKFDGTNWTTYDQSNSGISGVYVQTIAIDKQGNKWFGTYNGASMFDDTNWTVYNTSNSSIASDWLQAIAVDTMNNKWLGTDNGVTKFDGTNWTTYNSSNSGIGGNLISSIAVDSLDNKWIGDGIGVSMFDGANWTTYDQSNSSLSMSPSAIAIDTLDNKWFGTGWGVYELGYCGIAPKEEICYVEFDSTSSKNSINWRSILPVSVDSVRIYKETSTNVWSLIGSVPSNQNQFIDVNSNPYNQSYSYKITTIDTCGNESDSSVFHTTITLLGAYNQGTNTYGFTWSAYQGLAIANYYLYGVTVGGTETLIGTVNGNQYFYNYTNPDSNYVKYFVGFYTPDCNSKSNHLVKSNWVQSATGINELTNIDNLITLYPNPSALDLTLEVSEKSNVEILNMTGQVIMSINDACKKITIDIKYFSSGIYLIKVITDKGIAIKKFIKE